MTKKAGVFINVLIVGIVLLSLNSCKKKEEATTTGSVNNTSSSSENKAFSVQELDAGLSIKGAVKKKDTVPSPTSTIDYEITSKNSPGIQDVGFDIKITSTTDLKGAYIVFKDIDGNKSTEHFNVDFSKLNNRTQQRNQSKLKSPFFKKTEKKQRQAPDTNEYVIDVDFSEDVTPGKFCYDLYVYTSNGISQVTKVCKTVKAWGGKSELVGVYKVNHVDDVVVDTCNGDSTSLVGHKSFSIYKNYKNHIREFTFKIDGTIEYHEENETWVYHTLKDSINNCYQYPGRFETKESYTSKGKWFFDDNKSQIIAVGYSVDDLMSSKVDVYDRSELEGIEIPVLTFDQFYFSSALYKKVIK